MSTVLRKKIGKDDVIILNEKLIPHKVRILDGYSDQSFSPQKDYDVIGVSWINFSDKTRMLGYILVNDKGIMDIYASSWFVGLKG